MHRLTDCLEQRSAICQLQSAGPRWAPLCSISWSLVCSTAACSTAVMDGRCEVTGSAQLAQMQRQRRSAAAHAPCAPSLIPIQHCKCWETSTNILLNDERNTLSSHNHWPRKKIKWRHIMETLVLGCVVQLSVSTLLVTCWIYRYALQTMNH